MYNRLDNLHDYAIIVHDLKGAGGRRDRLYSSIQRKGYKRGIIRGRTEGITGMLVISAIAIVGYVCCSEHKKKLNENKELKRKMFDSEDGKKGINGVERTADGMIYKRVYPVCPHTEHGVLDYLGNGDYKCSVCGVELHDYRFDGKDYSFKFKEVAVGDDLSKS